jgi:hypothetical protein
VSGFDDLDDLILAARQQYGLRPEDLATRAAPAVERQIRATANAGTDPNGKPWEPKKGGGRALEHAAAHISTKASGALIRTTLTGPDVFHHFGTARVPKRQVLPDAGAGIPDPIAAVLLKAAGDSFDKAFGGK